MLLYNNSKINQNILFLVLWVTIILGCLFKENNCYNMERILQNRRIRSFQRSYQNDNKIWVSNRNSLIKVSKQELKLIGGISKNCFFTPIQCMIQHDTNKLSRMLDQTNKY
ncbi:hypothetical protein ACQ4LE_009711 [Meloidogyne hapla]